LNLSRNFKITLFNIYQAGIHSEMKKLISVLVLLVVGMLTFGQSPVFKDTTLKNTIRLNVSNPFIFGKKALIVGYERQLSGNKSFSFNIGSMSFPKLKAIEANSADSVILLQNKYDRGFHVSGDFRFYLLKENKFSKPHGLYIGPYVSFNHMNKQNTWSYRTSAFSGDITTDLDLNLLTIGGQMGYQFLFGKHWAVDMVMFGPGLGFYNFNAKLNTTLAKEQQSFLFRTLSDFVGQYIPAYAKLNNEGEIETSGNSRSVGWGYRYVIHLGYRF
jgi:hypothetical protein